jgi:hypothetical protein
MLKIEKIVTYCVRDNHTVRVFNQTLVQLQVDQYLLLPLLTPIDSHLKQLPLDLIEREVTHAYLSDFSQCNYQEVML